jgi:carboxyl-terminal processing protease
MLGSMHDNRPAPGPGGAWSAEPPGPPPPWRQLPPPPSAEPPRRGGGIAGRLATAILVGLLLFGAGSAFGRLTAPVAAGSPVAASAAAPSLTTPAGTPAASPADSAAADATPEPTPAATPLPVGQTPDWSLLDEAYTKLRQAYVDQSALDPNVLVQGAIAGMLSALNDRGHTGYMTRAEVASRDQQLTGSFVGVGIVMDDRTGQIVVARVLPASPALAAGVLAGEIIVRVDGTSIEGLTAAQIVSKVRGVEGTPVTLTLEAPDGTQRDVTMTRRTINIPVVSWAFAPGTHQAVVRLESFSSGAADALVKAINEARAGGATGIAFDLRGNSGGFVSEAMKVASQFLASGTVYVSVDKTGQRTSHDALPGGVATDIPLVVLVDGQTASASEIVTGALQDAGRARVVGVTTYGTGTVVNTFPLSDGSALAIGTERWLTPKGHAIWREGLTPDEVVPMGVTVAYVTPDDFATLGAGGIAGSPDVQLAAALKALSAAEVSGTH